MKRISHGLAALCFALLLSGPGRLAYPADCNQNGIDDEQDIAQRTSHDCNVNGVPDECEFVPGQIAFELPRMIPDGGEPFSMVLDDLDGDGDLDIATAGQDIRVLRNQGRGVFGEPEIYPLGEWARWEILEGDLDGNGSADLIAVCRAEDGVPVPVLLNRGDGTFSMKSEAPFPTGGRHPVLADFDGDRYLDLAVTGTRQDGDGGYYVLGDVYWSRNLGNGSFAEAQVLSVAEHAGGILPVDINQDGAIDMAVNDFNKGEDGTGAATVVLLNRGDGTFLDASSYPAPKGAALATVIDGHGSLDLVLFSYLSSDISILRNQGDGTFAEAESLPVEIAGGISWLHAADLDGDGDTDLAAGGRTETDSADSSVEVFLNDGRGTFQTQVTAGLPYLGAPVTADLNGDTRPEMVLRSGSSFNPTVSVLDNLGDGKFGALGSFYYGIGGSGPDMQVRDIDGDLDLDIVMGYYGGVKFLENVTGAQEFHLGCDPFLRGDVNADGALSVSDVVMLRRSALEGELIPCRDAADVTDDEVADFVDDFSALLRILFDQDWTLAVPAPFPEPGLDPTQSPAYNQLNQGRELHMDARLECARYRMEPPEKTLDLIRLGDVTAVPGTEVRIPVYISNSVPVEAVQLVLEHDPEVLEIIPDSLSYERTYYERWVTEEHPWACPQLSVLTVHPAAGIATAAIAGGLIRSDRAIPPGSDTLIAWIHVRVSESALPGTTHTLQPTNGEDGLGVGPYRLRNEITFDGTARLVSTIPELEGSILRIVMDQMFFRGDSNSDSDVNLSDAVSTLNYLFCGGAGPTCMDAADADDSGALDISDPVYLLGFLFLGSSAPGQPFRACGPDPTPDGLKCAVFRPCE